MLISENINPFNNSARTLQTDRQTDKWTHGETDWQTGLYYGNTAVCIDVHRTLKTIT